MALKRKCENLIAKTERLSRIMYVSTLLPRTGNHDGRLAVEFRSGYVGHGRRGAGALA